MRWFSALSTRGCGAPVVPGRQGYCVPPFSCRRYTSRLHDAARSCSVRTPQSGPPSSFAVAYLRRRMSMHAQRLTYPPVTALRVAIWIPSRSNARSRGRRGMRGRTYELVAIRKSQVHAQNYGAQNHGCARCLCHLRIPPRVYRVSFREGLRDSGPPERAWMGVRQGWRSHTYVLAYDLPLQCHSSSSRAALPVPAHISLGPFAHAFLYYNFHASIHWVRGPHFRDDRLY
ncbi:hypothetical protein K438DRAFT_1274191 [Mycena galopus ATCC 62051]|nr:hypothetical protein K438DRAFT_1274191 [Mycena galopus ATCC 62051]